MSKTSAKLAVFEQKYNLQLGVIQNQCVDLILGQDLIKQHCRVVFEVNEKNIVIDLSICTVPAAKINPICIFKNVDLGLRPISTKSRRFNVENQQFTLLEIRKLLDDDIIEPSTSPWPAEVCIADDGRQKRRL